MTGSTYVVRTYLPWVREGLVGSTPTMDTLGAGVPARAELPLDVWVNDPTRKVAERHASAPLRFYGPSDVTGIDPAQIVRTEPLDHATDVEPNYFALVEFRRPDLPWLFTPAQADASGRLRPWLVLVIVRREQAKLTSSPGQPLPVLEVKRSALPDLADSWAWAHVQVTRGAAAGTTESIDHAIEHLPDRVVSRLVCALRLAERTSYFACVVPAFAGGRQAGLGEDVTEGDLQPAWSAGTDATPLRLPVYHHWEFSTGLEGDFETLAQRIEGRELPEDVGTLKVDLTAPGWGMPRRTSSDQAAVTRLAGALRPSAEPSWNDTAFKSRLRTLLDPAAPGPDVTPPIYGQWYSRATAVPDDAGTPAWLRELNLDPRRRIAAGLGALVVQYEQERLMASAWDQLAEHEDDDAQVRRTQLAEEVGRALFDKHVDGMTPTQLVQVAGSALPDASGVAQADAGFRKLSRGTGPDGGDALHTSLQGVVPAAAAAVAADAANTATQALGEGDETDLPVFSPRFREPMYEALRDWAGDMLLPGLDRLPPNSIALVDTNPEFIESFLVGLNHELSRELIWRGFPTDRRGTYFTRFWEARGGASERTTDGPGTIGEIRDWPGTTSLGSHLAGSGGEGQLALVIRADLLRRFPRAVIYAVEATWSTDGKSRVLGTNERYPLFRGSWGADIAFLGFDLGESEAAGAPAPPGHAGWFFVIQEQPTEPRFGFDQGEAGPRAPATVATWSDVSWDDVLGPNDAAGEAFVKLAGPLAGQAKPVRPASKNGGAAPTTATWGATSAHMALIAQQAPFRLAVHASTWLEQAGATG
jgi:hypothetical protein